MNLSNKYQELIMVLTNFLDGSITVDILQTFVWEVIDYFSTNEKRDLPAEEEFEKVFWHVVWQVQHMATKDHLDNGSVWKELEEALLFLKGERKLPEEYIGQRP